MTVQQRSLANTDNVFKTMMYLAAPVFIEQLFAMLVGWVDYWLAGRFLEPSHLAAMGLMAYIIWVIPCVFSVVAIGATALVSRFYGAEDFHMARRATNQAAFMGIIMMTVITLLAALFHRELIELMQLEPVPTELAIEYLDWIIWVIPFMVMLQVGRACLQGAGDIISGFLTMVLVNILNMLISAALVTGWGPFPQLGWQGLAVGTAVAYCVGGLITLGLLLCNRFGLGLRLKLLKPDPDMLKRILRIGVPGGIDMVCVVFFQMWFLTIINSLGTVQAAAHATALRIESLAYLPGHAFSVAATTLVGQFLGAKKPKEAERSALLASGVGGGFMSLVGILFFFAAVPLTGFFAGEHTGEAVALSAPLIQIVSVAMPALAVVIILTGSLRGAGDTKWPLIFSMIGLVVIRIPIAYYLAWDEFTVPVLDWHVTGMNLGVIGAWYAMVVDIIIRSLLVGGRFLHGGWKHVKV